MSATRKIRRVVSLVLGVPFVAVGNILFILILVDVATNFHQPNAFNLFFRLDTVIAVVLSLIGIGIIRLVGGSR